MAEDALKNALGNKAWTWEEDVGGGAFYGPKIDIKIRDAIGRSWQCSTVQVDFNLPERFNLTYMTANANSSSGNASDDGNGISQTNARERPILIHRAIFGSLERFFGILVENFAGAFPIWLAPVQLRLLPVADRHREWCEQVILQAKQRGIRCDMSQKGLRLGKAIRSAEMAKVPIMGVVGDKEIEQEQLAVRIYTGSNDSEGGDSSGDVGSMRVTDLIEKIERMNRERVLETSLDQ